MMPGILYSLAITFLPVVIYRQMMRKKGRVLTKAHRFWSDVFVLYIWLVLFVTGVGSVWDFLERGGLLAAVRTANFNGLPFAHGLTMTALLNILLFVPLGFLLPHIWTTCRNGIKVTLTGYFFSAAVELAQIPTNRVVDVEDLLMNTLGTFLGFLFWKGIGNYLFQGHVTKRVLLLSRREPLVYMMLTFLMPFFFYNWRWFI